MKKRKNPDEDRKHRFCDPGMCHCCQDLGDGNFWCGQHEKMVVAGWDATGDLLYCKRKGRKGRSDSTQRGNDR